MPLASLDVVIPESRWISDVSRRHPGNRFRIHSVMDSEDGQTALIQLIGPDVPSLVYEIGEYTSVPDVTVLNQQRDEAVLHLRTRTPILFNAVSMANASITFPFDIVDGVATLEILASNRGLSMVRDRLTTRDIEYTVNRVHDRLEIGGPLSDRQLRLVREAVAQGYYDTPRDCTLTELADDLDLSASTVSTTLHRAEESIVKQFLEKMISCRPLSRQ